MKNTTATKTTKTAKTSKKQDAAPAIILTSAQTRILHGIRELGEAQLAEVLLVRVQRQAMEGLEAKGAININRHKGVWYLTPSKKAPEGLVLNRRQIPGGRDADHHIAFGTNPAPKKEKVAAPAKAKSQPKGPKASAVRKPKTEKAPAAQTPAPSSTSQHPAVLKALGKIANAGQRKAARS